MSRLTLTRSLVATALVLGATLMLRSTALGEGWSFHAPGTEPSQPAASSQPGSGTGSWSFRAPGSEPGPAAPAHRSGQAEEQNWAFHSPGGDSPSSGGGMRMQVSDGSGGAFRSTATPPGGKGCKSG